MTQGDSAGQAVVDVHVDPVPSKTPPQSGRQFSTGPLAILASMAVSAAVAAAVAVAVVGGGNDEAQASFSRGAPMAATSRAIQQRRLLDGENSTLDDDGPFCFTTTEGELCHRLVLWAMDDGLRFHPDRFQGLKRSSPLEDFQAALHRLHPEYCPLPCVDKNVAPQPLVAFNAEAERGSCDYGWGGDNRPSHAGCFVVRGGHLLVVKLTYDGFKYDVPGGQTDWREPARCTAHRETWEESGYRAAPRDLIGVMHGNFRLYRCDLLQGNPVKGPDHEISWVGWMSREEVQAKAAQGHFRFPEAHQYANWM